MSRPTRPAGRGGGTGKGFVYLDEHGERLGADDVARCMALVIPPAWKDVWICPAPNGHIQAVGTDDAGRRQYLYHPVWREQRDKAKHDRVLDVAARLPQRRKTVAEHLALPGMPRERALGTAFRLLDLGFFRVGGEVYAEENGSYGLATIEKQHVRVTATRCSSSTPPSRPGATRGRRRRRRARRRVDAAPSPRRRPRAARVPRRAALARRVVGRHQPLRQGGRRRRGVGEGLPHVARHRAGGRRPRRSCRPATSTTRRGRAIRGAMVEVAEYLGNTPTVARGSYVDPRSSTCSSAARRSPRRCAASATATRCSTATRSNEPCCGCCALSHPPADAAANDGGEQTLPPVLRPRRPRRRRRRPRRRRARRRLQPRLALARARRRRPRHRCRAAVRQGVRHRHVRHERQAGTADRHRRRCSPCTPGRWASSPSATTSSSASSASACSASIGAWAASSRRAARRGTSCCRA